MAIRLIPGQHIHFVGIGGTGLSAIANLLLQQGFQITGSDKASNQNTRQLRTLGAKIFKGHDAVHVGNAELLVVSSAVSKDNVEVLAAQAQNIPVYKRNHIIAAIMDGHINIAVAGTHGKTTTTSMIAHILKATEQNPSYIVGGIMGNTGKNAEIGRGKSFIIEADEYDNMFLGLEPTIAVVTNIEFDHPDFFATPNHLVSSFSKFIGLLPKNGKLIACVDDHTTQIFANNRRIVGLPTITYGVKNRRAEWRAVNISTNGKYTSFDVKNGQEDMGTVLLNVPGIHNVQNALAALVVAYDQGVDFTKAADALAQFKTTGRRFDVRSDINDIAVIDDYAHHPTAIRTTINAAKARYPKRKIWAVWQPHTFSRTKQLMDAFTRSFDKADHAIITPIYASREMPLEGVNNLAIIANMKHKSVHATESLDDTVKYLKEHVKSPAVILIMSAGDAPEIGEKFIKAQKEPESQTNA